MVLTKENLTKQIKLKLGGNVVKLELTDACIDQAIEESIDEYIGIFGINLYKSIPVSYNQTIYNLSSWELDSVSDIKAIQGIEANLIYGYGIYEYPGVPKSMAMEFAFDYYNWLRQNADVRALIGGVIDWMFDRQTHILHLKVPAGIENVMIEYQKDLGEQERLNLVRLLHRAQFFKLCVAHTKETLGLIRRKYNGVPIPGGQLELDGRDLITEGKEESQLMLDELGSMREDFIMKG